MTFTDLNDAKEIVKLERPFQTTPARRSVPGNIARGIKHRFVWSASLAGKLKWIVSSGLHHRQDAFLALGGVTAS
jgi:hypothetical protein